MNFDKKLLVNIAKLDDSFFKALLIAQLVSKDGFTGNDSFLL